MKTIGEIRKARRASNVNLSRADKYIGDITEELFNRAQEGEDEIDYVLWDGVYESGNEMINLLLKELRGKGFNAEAGSAKTPWGGARTILRVGIKPKTKGNLLKRGILRFLIVAIIVITLICILI